MALLTIPLGDSTINNGDAGTAPSVDNMSTLSVGSQGENPRLLSLVQLHCPRAPSQATALHRALQVPDTRADTRTDTLINLVCGSNPSISIMFVPRQAYLPCWF